MALVIYTREQWGARQPLSTKPMVPGRITVHHVAGSLTSVWMGKADKFSYGVSVMQYIQNDHMKPENWIVQDGKKVNIGGRGFQDIGYHYVIGPDGTVWKGRNELVEGAHAASTTYDKYANQYNIGISLYGNFDKESLSRGSAQYNALIELLARVMKAYGIPTSKIYPHNHFNPSKTCPGSKVLPMMDAIRNDAYAFSKGSTSIQPTSVTVTTPVTPNAPSSSYSTFDIVDNSLKVSAPPVYSATPTAKTSSSTSSATQQQKEQAGAGVAIAAGLIIAALLAM